MDIYGSRTEEKMQNMIDRTTEYIANS